MPDWVKKNLRVSILAVLYTVGIVGIGFAPLPYSDWFLSLSSLQLLITALVIFPRDFTPKFLGASLLILALGFSIEVAGVKTGVIFGSYAYGDGLWPLAIEVPLIIGFNWWILVYSSYELWRRMVFNRWILAFFGASSMVLIDLLIEPVAPKLDYWQFEGGVAPVLNYLSWFAIAYAFQLITARYASTLQLNNTARVLYFMQVIFFGILNLVL